MKRQFFNLKAPRVFQKSCCIFENNYSHYYVELLFPMPPASLPLIKTKLTVREGKSLKWMHWHFKGVRSQVARLGWNCPLAVPSSSQTTLRKKPPPQSFMFRGLLRARETYRKPSDGQRAHTASPILRRYLDTIGGVQGAHPREHRGKDCQCMGSCVPHLLYSSTSTTHLLQGHIN